MKKATIKQVKDPRAERLIQTLEGIVRDYKSGKGDVLNRFASNDLSDSGCESLKEILSGVLFGDQRQEIDRGGSITLAPRDHHALRDIGDGSVERGVAVVIGEACRWARKDAAGMARWFMASRSCLDETSIDVYLAATNAFVTRRAWSVSIRSPKWYEILYVVIEKAAEDVPDVGFIDTIAPDDIIRTMALCWKLRNFARRAQAVSA